MRKAFPLLLTLFIAILAIVLSLTSKPSSNTTAQAITVTPTPWPTEHSDIPADPATVFGSLNNGMRYIILPNAEPPDRTSLRLHINVGSLMEADDQRGLAHFLEHMVFNGTKTHKDANELIRKMQARGIAFGAHVNAYTSFDETVYMLDLPDLQDDTLDLTFTIMRDFADGALLSETEIDAERGVILSEKRSRDSVAARIQEKQFEILLPDSKISQRFPIGTEDVIKTATKERFLDLYDKYYIPSRMTFIVVGDIAPAEVEERIKATFSTMENPEQPGENPDLGTITPPTGLQVHVDSDPELDSTELSLLLIRKHQQQPDTTENRSAKIPVALAHSILNRRFQRLSKKENSPISSGSASKSVWFNEVEFGSISVTATENRWEDAVPLLEQTFRQALEHGFTEAELSQAKAKYLNSYQQAVKRKDSRKSDALASGIARSINDHTVYSTPETNLKIATNALDSITAEKIHQDFSAFWKAEGYHLILTTESDRGENAVEKLTTLYRKSTAQTLEKPTAREAAKFAYTDLGEPGSIDSQKEIEDLGITQLRLTNHIRINLKKTDFQKNQIRIIARIGSGQLSQPEDTPLLTALASSVFNYGGLGKHSNDELTEILAGKNVSSTLSISEDTFEIIGSTTPKDQRLQLQLMTAWLTDPGYRLEGLWQFQKGIPALYQNLKHTISGPYQKMQAWLHGDDFRYSIPNQTKLSNYTIEDVRNWLNPELSEAYLEISIVGDFNQEQLTQDLLETFGTLPDRRSSPSEQTINPRSVSMPEAPNEKTFSYQSKVPQAVATAIWPTDGLRHNIPETRRLNILVTIFNDRIRAEIREKLGASYSPRASFSGSSALQKFSYLSGQSIGTAEDIPLLLTTMETISTELAEKGASKDELQRALAPTLKILEKSLRDNNYWLFSVLSSSQANPEQLDLCRNRRDDYQSITLEEINTLAKKYFPTTNLIKISILPD